jgi:hypothetical protein
MIGLRIRIRFRIDGLFPDTIPVQVMLSHVMAEQCRIIDVRMIVFNYDFIDRSFESISLFDSNDNDIYIYIYKVICMYIYIDIHISWR